MMCINYGLIQKSLSDPIVDEIITALTNLVQIRRDEKTRAISKKIAEG